jgi:hypothetical protein
VASMPLEEPDVAASAVDGLDSLRVRCRDGAMLVELSEFLRRCGCRTEHVDLTTVDVGLDATPTVAGVMGLLRADLCCACGSPIEPALARLGSILCLDCRPEFNGNLGRPAGPAARRRWARMQIEAYLSVWEREHPDAGLVVG